MSSNPGVAQKHIQSHLIFKLVLPYCVSDRPRPIDHNVYYVYCVYPQSDTYKPQTPVCNVWVMCIGNVINIYLP